MEKEKVINLLKQLGVAIKSDIETCETEIKKAEDIDNSTIEILHIGKKAGLELALTYLDIAIIDLSKGRL